MKRVQKMARLMLGSIVVGLVLSVIAVLALYFKVDMPKALLGFCLMGIAGMGGFGVLFKKDEGKIVFDERDKVINHRAALAGFGTAYIILCLAAMIPWFVLGPKATISINWLPNILMAAGLGHYTAWSIAILAQYGWRDKDNE